MGEEEEEKEKNIGEIDKDMKKAEKEREQIKLLHMPIHPVSFL